MIGVWLLARQSTDRTIASLSAIEACSGKCSLNWTPGIFVSITP